MYLLALSFDAAVPAERRVTARRGWAGEISGHFEHPAALTPSAPFDMNSAVFHV